ncbi:peptide ABC transporter ATPase [Solibacillus daqui]|uniref:tubby C-terminal domain-like protein n=1 Tax=Solibacillus daqui TaxID=2912187 RepID=UPI002365C5C1|nr:peptide ABC transporter ATPase [Solibacillus daqui]
MQQFTYKALGDIKSTNPQPIRNEAGEQVQLLERVYDNGLKRLLDGYFDYRYFLKYRVTNNDGAPIFEAKKIFRRGKVWFEGKDFVSNETYRINYENWRIGLPELFVSGPNLKMKIDKEMEDWSNFIVEDEIIARWKASYDEASDEFTVMLELAESAPVQNTAFYIAIAQATLFIGV